MFKYYFTMFLLFNTPNLYAGKCGQSIFNKGTLKKYKHIQNSILDNLSQFGSSTTTAYVAEGVTGISDPGVTTGVLTSTSQALSSWGPCSTLDGGVFGASFRRQYFQENKDELKREIARGQGAHLTTLAFLYRCALGTQAVGKFAHSIKKKFHEIVELDQTQAHSFDQSILQVINTTSDIHCSPLT